MPSDNDHVESGGGGGEEVAFVRACEPVPF